MEVLRPPAAIGFMPALRRSLRPQAAVYVLDAACGRLAVLRRRSGAIF